MTNTNFGARSAASRAAPLVLFTLGYLNMPTFWARRLYVTTWWLSILGILALGFTQDAPGNNGFREPLTERLNWFPLPAIFFGLATWAVVSLVQELRRSKRSARAAVQQRYEDERNIVSEALAAVAAAEEAIEQFLAIEPEPEPEPRPRIPASPPAISKLIIPSYIGAGKRVRRGGVTLGGTKINDRRGRDPRDII